MSLRQLSKARKISCCPANWIPTASGSAIAVANQFLETDLEKLKAAVSMGYARGKLFEVAKTLPRDRKDWYD